MPWKSRRLAAVVLSSLGVLATTAPHAWGASFQSLGSLPGATNITVGDVSGDGRVVVGGMQITGGGYKAWRWENGVMTLLGDLPGGSISLALSTSRDGSVIVGTASSARAAPSAEPFRWEGGVMTALADLPGAKPYGRALGVSPDGSMVVGYCQAEMGGAFLHKNGTTSLLPGLSGSSIAQADDLSSDGKMIVGEAWDTDGRYYAVSWTDAGISKLGGLGGLVGGTFVSHAKAVSADGLVSVGLAANAQGNQEAFRWEDGVMTGLGDLPGGSFMSVATSVSANGSLIGGAGTRPIDSENFSSGGEEAFIWDEAHGMRHLETVLTQEYGLNLQGWTLIGVRAMSADGLTLVGDGYRQGGAMFEGWVARVPEPSILLLMATGLPLVLKRRRHRQTG